MISTEFETAKRAFEKIYTEDVWSHGSGPGSLPSSTVEYRAFIERFIYENRIITVTDLGCGDWQFSRYIDWSKTNYLGLDVAPSVIEKNQRLFSSSNIKFEVSHGFESLPGGDLLLSKEVLQHLPNAMVLAYLNVISQKYKFALFTNSVAPGGNANSDISVGEYRPLKLEDAPFHACGAVVFTYYPCSEFQMWRNAVFLMLGNRDSLSK